MIVFTFLKVFIFSVFISTKLVNAAASGYEGTSIQAGTGTAELNSCRIGVKALTFDYTMLGLGSFSKYWDVMCGYPPATGTFLLCAYELSGNDTSLQPALLKTFSKRCKKYSSYSYDASYYTKQFENATEYYVPLSQLNTSNPIYVATLPNMTSLESTYVFYQNRVFNIDASTWFAVGICGYFLLLIFISTIYNILRLTGITKSINNSRVSKLIQKYIISSPLIPNGKFSQPYGFKYFTMLIPNRIQFLVDLFLFALEVAFYCVPYRNTTKPQKWSYLAHRSGVMALGKLPLLILFAGRNNFLLWITGWSYSTFLHFHKVVAGWMFVDALIHSVAYTIDSLGYYVESLHERYFACGVAATTIAGVLLLQSFHVFRSFFYEYFLALHVMLAASFLAMVWYHCIDEGWMEWIVAACCVWFFDRLVRVIRMSFFGYKTAKVTSVGEGIIKVEVPKPTTWIHTPGTYGFIYFAGFIFWENHPFTIVVDNNHLCAFIRAKMGVTARVWSKLKKNNGEMSCKVCIEGPYGGNLSIMQQKYEDKLFISGGSGVPGILEAAGKSMSGKLIWIVPTLAFVKAYDCLLKRCSLPVDIYVTRENFKNVTFSQNGLFSKIEADSQTSDSSEKEPDEDEMIVRDPQQISVYYGKPDMNSIIDNFVSESPSNNIAIITCGPPVMSDHIRNIYSSNIITWEKSVDIFDELVVW